MKTKTSCHAAESEMAVRTITIAFGTVCLVTGALIGADEGAFSPVLSNHPDLIRPVARVHRT